MSVSDDEDDQQQVKLGALVEAALQSLPPHLAERVYDWRPLKKQLKKSAKKPMAVGDLEKIRNDVSARLEEFLPYILTEHERLSHSVMKLVSNPVLHTRHDLPGTVVAAVVAASRSRQQQSKLSSQAETGAQASGEPVADLKLNTAPQDASPSTSSSSGDEDSGCSAWSSPSTAARLARLSTLELVEQCRDLEVLENDLLAHAKLVKVNGLNFKKAASKLAKCYLASVGEGKSTGASGSAKDVTSWNLDEYPAYVSYATPYLASHRPYILAAVPRTHDDSKGASSPVPSDAAAAGATPAPTQGQGDIFQFLEVALIAAADDLTLRRSLIETELGVRKGHVAGQPVTLLQQLRLNQHQDSIKKDYVERQRSHSVSAAAATVATPTLPIKTDGQGQQQTQSASPNIPTDTSADELSAQSATTSVTPPLQPAAAVAVLEEKGGEKGKKKGKKDKDKEKKKDKDKENEKGKAKEKEPEAGQEEKSQEKTELADQSSVSEPRPEIAVQVDSQSTVALADKSEAVSAEDSHPAPVPAVEHHERAPTEPQPAVEQEKEEEEDDEDSDGSQKKKKKKKKEKKLQKKLMKQATEAVGSTNSSISGLNGVQVAVSSTAAPVTNCPAGMPALASVDVRSNSIVATHEQALLEAAAAATSSNRKRLWFIDQWEEHRALMEGVSFSDVQMHEQDVLYSHHHYASLATQVLAALYAGLYLFNTSLFLPSAAFFAVELGYDPYWGAILMGIMAASAVVGNIFSRVAITRLGYKFAICSHALCAILGNLLYAFSASATTSNAALSRAIAAACVLGLGASEVIVRDIISTRLPIYKRASATRILGYFLAVGLVFAPVFAAIHSAFQMAIFDPAASPAVASPSQTEAGSATTAYMVLKGLPDDTVLIQSSAPLASAKALAYVSLNTSHPHLNRVITRRATWRHSKNVKNKLVRSRSHQSNLFIEDNNSDSDEPASPEAIIESPSKEAEPEVPGGGAVTAAGMVGSIWFLIGLLLVFGFEEPPRPPASQHMQAEDEDESAEDPADQGFLAFVARTFSGKPVASALDGHTHGIELTALPKDAKPTETTSLLAQHRGSISHAHVVVPIHDPEQEELLIKSGRLQRLPRATVRAVTKTQGGYGATDQEALQGEAAVVATTAGVVHPYVPDFPLPPLATSTNRCLPLSVIFLTAAVARAALILTFAGMPVLAAAQFGWSLPLSCVILGLMCVGLCFLPTFHTHVVVTWNIMSEITFFLVSLVVMCLSAAILAFAPFSKVIPSALKLQQEQSSIAGLTELGIGPMLFALTIIALAFSARATSQCATIFLMQRDHPSFNNSFFSAVDLIPALDWSGASLGCFALAAALLPLAIPEAALGLHNTNSVAIVAAVGVEISTPLLLFLAFGPLAVVAFCLWLVSLYTHTILPAAPLFTLLEN